MTKLFASARHDYSVTVKTDWEEGREIATDIVGFSWPDGTATTEAELIEQGFVIQSLEDCQEEMDRLARG